MPREGHTQAGFVFSRHVVLPDLVVQRKELRLTAPALTAVELAEPTSAESIDVALRTRMATLAGMHDALTRTANRPGNRARLRLLIDSRDEPWSVRAASPPAAPCCRHWGWRSNAAISVLGRGLLPRYRVRAYSAGSGDRRPHSSNRSRPLRVRSVATECARPCRLASASSPGRCWKSILRSSFGRFGRRWPENRPRASRNANDSPCSGKRAVSFQGKPAIGPSPRLAGTLERAV